MNGGYDTTEQAPRKSKRYKICTRHMYMVIARVTALVTHTMCVPRKCTIASVPRTSLSPPALLQTVSLGTLVPKALRYEM